MRYLILIATTLLFANPTFAKPTESVAAKTTSDKYDFRFSPLGLFIGAINMDLNIAIDTNWTLGPQLGLLRHKFKSDYGYTSDFDTRAFMLGARANWFKNGNFTDGLYVGPSLKWAGVKVETSDSGGPVTATASLLVASALVGYGWFWDSFNIMLGGGLALGLGNSRVELTNSNGTKQTVPANVAGLDFEFALGWTF